MTHRQATQGFSDTIQVTMSTQNLIEILNEIIQVKCAKTDITGAARARLG
jgi:hypothetical protein